jgi:two-component system nitrogen regulation response regulator GlnG
VLITGESGTGKELVARALHRHSLRRERPFLPVHVAALNPNLIESELFGHVKGAFTGANQARPGLLSLVPGGTIFLDELGDIPLPVQAKLLRVLEHQEVLPVGATAPEKIDVRLLAATNADLLKAIQNGHFRHDLYYRLNVFEIKLPALKERLDDIRLLAEHFLLALQSQSSLPEATVAFLTQRRWPGNVRELRNAMEHASIVARGGPILPEHFPEPLAALAPGPIDQRIGDLVREWTQSVLGAQDDPTTLYEQLLAIIEPPLIDEVLQKTNNNRVATARRLGLARATLRKMMQKFNLNAPGGDEE